LTWIRLDDEMLDNKKIVRVGPLGFALHTAGIIYCAHNLTDGFIPIGRLNALLDLSGVVVHGDRADGFLPWGDFDGDCRDGIVPLVFDVAKVLVGENLWHDVPLGYQIHDYLDYNPSRAQVLADREAKRAAGRAGGQAAAKARATNPASATAPAQAESQQKAKQNSTPVPVPVPVLGSKEPSVGSLQPNGYGIPKASMHVEGGHHVSKILGTLQLQSKPRKETG
jgi:hypothetical protein